MGDMVKGNIAIAEAAVRAGVEVYPYEAFLSEAGIGLGGLLPLAKPDCPDVTADIQDITEGRRI